MIHLFLASNPSTPINPIPSWRIPHIFWDPGAQPFAPLIFAKRGARFPGALDAMAFREDQVAAAVTFLTHDRGLRGWIAEACAAEIGRDW